MGHSITNTCCTSLAIVSGRGGLIQTVVMLMQISCLCHVAVCQNNPEGHAGNTNTASKQTRLRHEKDQPPAAATSTGGSVGGGWTWPLQSWQTVFHQLRQSHWPRWGIYCKQKIIHRGCLSQQQAAGPMKAPRQLIMNWCAQRKHRHRHTQCLPLLSDGGGVWEQLVSLSAQHDISTTCLRTAQRN